MPKAPKIAAALILLAVLPAVLLSQTKRKPKIKPAATTTTPQSTPAPTPEPQKTPDQKRNERPADPSSNGNQTKANNAAQPPSYFYEFVRPGFIYSPIKIAYDEAGRGQITFQKEGSRGDAVTDPIELSPVTLDKINGAFTALNFLDSNETYQTPRDYSNMGNATITVKKDGRSRSAKFNWTDNKHARILADEYRRISNEYIWRFEITIARDNQPLSAPDLLDEMDDYLKRQEISDPPQMLPTFRELSNDERIPLIARNHAAKLVKQIEKAKK